MGQWSGKHADGKGRMAYIYIPNEHVLSVRSKGYMSMRALYDSRFQIDVGKYVPRLKAAKAEYADLVQLIEEKKCSTLEEDVLTYLDWRVQDEHPGLQGSKAIYFLWAPIPDDPDVQTCMANFLRHRTLFKFELPMSAIAYPVGTPVSATERTDSAFWLEVWRSELKKRKAFFGPQLWFSGIPHAYFVPNNGLVYSSALCLVK